MRKILLLLILISFYGFSQNTTESYRAGEYLKYKINYGLINAGFATLEISDTLINAYPLHHVIGRGWSAGMVHLFFPVEDDYQTFIHKESLQPYRFIRKINEGGYTKDKEIFFDYEKKEAKVINHKNKTEKTFTIVNDIQDLLSTLYYLRNQDLSSLNKEDIISVNMFLDNEIIEFKLIFKGKETINTKFGKVNTMIFNPLVQEGRIFKENEGVTVWITDDKNKIPIKIKASVLVGSLKAELVRYKGLSNYFPIIFN